MAIHDPALIPPDRGHLDEEERAALDRFEELVTASSFDEAHDVLEGLWLEAVDAHRDLFQGLANALAAICARENDKLRGAREIAAETHTMLARFPRVVLGIHLDALLASMDRFVDRGDGVLALRQEA